MKVLTGCLGLCPPRSNWTFCVSVFDAIVRRGVQFFGSWLFTSTKKGHANSYSA